MTISLAIMHAAFSPERRAMLGALLRSLADSEFELRQHVTAIDVIADRDRLGPWPVAKRAWMAGANAGADYHLVLQDDTIAAPNLLKALPLITAAVPNQAISLWCNRPTVMIAAAMTGSWMRGTSARGPALLMPTSMVAEFLSWQQMACRMGTPDDVRVSWFAAKHGRHIWFTVPSVVEHVGRVSTLGHPNGRWSQAGMMAPDAANIDWTRGATDPPLYAQPMDDPDMLTALA